MEQVKNSMTLDILQAMAVQTQPPKAGGKADSEFRKMMDKAAGGKEAKTEEAPKAESPAAGKSEAPVQKE